ncbi:MAG TPA: pitrilysin family protein [Blastocatellia bacterium]|nr:pitrilysin family protein [Blastocatellia bacterium]
MKKLINACLVLGLLMPLNASADSKIFPYKYFTDDLPNGLRVVTVPTAYPNIVALYIVVATGSRNEIEPGKSGFAHLFEHLMFRGTPTVSPQQYNAALKRAGADSNAYTEDDRTVYHTVFSKEDFDEILSLEADRFQNLKVPEALFKTETRAVLGEYNKNASSPTRKLYEVLRDTAFGAHTYKHTTMGYLRDVENMPDLYDYSLEFFKRYYRPEYTTIVVAGDVDHAHVLELVKKYWGNWQHGSYAPDIPVEPVQKEERSAHVDWPQPTLPWLAVAYKSPAYSDTDKDKAALDLIGNLGFSQNSELYQRLLIKEQKVDALGPDFEDHRDPYLVTVLARVKDPKDVDYVRGEIIKTLDSFKTQLVAKDKLDAVKSNLRYSFALSLDNSEAIAANIAPYIALRRTPETINQVYEIYAAITPEDLQAVAKKYFISEHRTIVTLSHKEKSENVTQK